ncbi:MAG: DNA polymerase III subunit gamma/tau [Elusimicrobia bacterium]|nr:DNA polymerase III subunit gamma/tau [Elusimicrobiota bacterium]
MSNSYVVLARKYRPQTFEEVVGQNSVSQTLLNAVEAGRVAHAYVFSGPRGVGKTTTARILAKCLNCAKGPTKTPCNSCEACVSISESNSMDDVLEIDGASNRGIEQIRELRETAKYAPARSRYRIFIIDEAHQITKDAFGALLKTLEEPPPHVVFMMATTEVQKIPAPILSRCQRFSLRPISAEHVFKHLKSICEKEKIKVDDDALADVVRFVEGSLRDALSLLDQAVVFAPTGISSHTIRDLLGLLPMDFIRSFAQTIQEGDPSAILQATQGAVQNGIDLTQLGKDLQGYYHNLLLAKAGVEEVFKVNSKIFTQAAESYDFQTLERNIRLLSRALNDMRHTETPRAVFEISVLRLGQKTLDPRMLIERLEKLEKSTPPSSSLSSTASAIPQKTFRTTDLALSPSRSTEKTPQPKEVPSHESFRPVTKDLSAKIVSSWENLVDQISKSKGSLGTALGAAAPEAHQDRITLTFDKLFNHDMVQRSMDILKGFIEKQFGTCPAIDLKIEKLPDPEKPPTPAAKSATAPAPASNRSMELNDSFEEIKPAEATSAVQKALKHFPGTVKREKKG